MANKENLIPNDKRTPAERRENARKAGRASGEARREKKRLRECMNILLDLEPTNARDWNLLAKMGVEPGDVDNRMLVAAALMKRAIKFGDVAAVKEIRSITGEDAPSDEAVQKLDKVLAKIEGTI